jgi:hypothetical protein
MPVRLWQKQLVIKIKTSKIKHLRYEKITVINEFAPVRFCLQQTYR